MLSDIEYRWSGQVMKLTNSMAFIGPNPNDEGSNNIYIATRDSENRMTRGTIAGILLTGMILGKENHWSSLYDPSFKTNENIIIILTKVMMSSENINLDSTSKEQRSKGARRKEEETSKHLWKRFLSARAR
ncbi:MAG: hypothetical protein WBL88_04530 [Nitrososphaeraceae archaeon]